MTSLQSMYDELVVESEQWQRDWALVETENRRLQAENERLRAALHAHHATTIEEVECRACKGVRGF